MSWTESVYLDCVAPDGRTGFVVRLARHVEDGTTWLWSHAFLTDTVLAFHDQSLPCAGGATAVEAADVTYGLEGRPAASFRRRGPRDAMHGAEVEVDALARPDPFTPPGSGEIPLRIEARFTPVRAAGGTLPGRTEVLGQVTGRVIAGDEEHPVAGWAQWHEQHQTEPRFTVPFTYATLRGDNAGAVLLCGPRRSGGLLWRGEQPEAVSAVELDSPGPVRGLVCHLAGGAAVSGKLATVHRYAVAVNGRPRPGTLVAGELDGTTVAGCVNDFDPAADQEES